MKATYKLIVFAILYSSITFAQNQTNTYKKRVLETAEADFLTSYYNQDGDNASVTGGIGSEKLNDFTPTVVVSVPLNDDDVLTIDAGISTYSSASSSNLNPFDRTIKVPKSSTTVITSASKGTTKKVTNYAYVTAPTPWAASSGASRADIWGNITGSYAHSSDNRNTIVDGDISVSHEFDYNSLGIGGGLTKLFNDKNTTLGLSANVYLDKWNPKYPTELHWYLQGNKSLNSNYFQGVPIYNQNGVAIDKTGNTTPVWNPVNYSYIQNKSRNSYSLSFSFAQILNKNAQFSLFFDVVKQQGWLSNPMQRVYFSDVANYYIGDPASIPNYTSRSNKNVFQLADDMERLPSSRLKLPIGMNFNYYLNETFVLRTYYRYYTDDWGIKSNTANIEIPIKISPKWTLYPSYRYYNQTAADYFAPYEQNLSTSTFYTSDYDLSKFNANQYGFGFGYTDIFASWHLWGLGLKNIDLKYYNYKRSTGLKASIITAGFKFVLD
ncbi:DUF3570 domain-containing protein [Yeosuana marina]|uniref:DUF3570 domain-containing protein n=1 Tax=Yeosuana marina TaxID=1565536 RepID=UPI0030C8383A